jgi:DNA topoisomerase-3
MPWAVELYCGASKLLNFGHFIKKVFLSGKIIKLETKEKKVDRPLLFDLTELQREANRRFGYTAQETLNIAQNLYEKHKLITYPRTDSRYLTSDLKSSIEKILFSINKNIKSSKIDELIKNGINIDSQIICDEKVTDHHAIIPTIKIETYDLSSLSNEEYNILKLITTRFIVILAQKHIFHETTCIIEIKNESFKSIGKTIIQDGWKAIENHFLKEKEEKKEKDQNLPLLKLGEILSQVKEIEVLAKKTTPKDKYTEATLLTAMENASEHVDDDLKEYMKEKGLGTPATRASIIERLLSMKYIERSAKNIIPTQFGIQFIDIIPEVLKNPDLTANWEFRLNQIYHQKEDPNKFMSDIEKFVSELIVNNKENKNNITIESKQEKETIGKCPICGKSIYENQKSFYCEGYKYDPKCQFSIWIENKFLDKKITKAMAKSFLSKGFANIKNNGLDMKIVMTINGNNQPNFYFEKKEIGRCPRCNQSILEGLNSFYCENNKECGFIIHKENKFFTNRGIIITSKIITEILKNKKFEARNLKSSTGKSYNAMFLLEDSNEGFVNFKMEFLN